MFSDYPCSAWPVTDGACCQRCDDLIVTPVRIVMATSADSALVIRTFRTAIQMHVVKRQIIQKWMKPVIKEIKHKHAN
jgi:hypothetical protein